MSTALLDQATDTLADLSAALDAGQDPAAVRERALEVARRAWRIAARCEVKEGAQAALVTTVQHGRWSIATDGASAWAYCPRCEALVHMPDPALIDDRIREHQRLQCAGDSVTTAAGYVAERYETFTVDEGI
jgi:hypothetical protein